MITTVTDATFDALVLRAQRPVLLEFTVSWCPPCRMIEPHLPVDNSVTLFWVEHMFE